MKRWKIWRLLAGITAGTLLAGGCVDGLRQATLTGVSDYVSGEVTSTLANTLPLEMYFSDFVHDLLRPTV
jgi:hypothetical protein